MNTSDTNSALRIAFLADTIDDGYGGAVVSADRFVTALREEHHVTVMATGPDDVDRVSLPTLSLPIHVMRAMRFRFAIPLRKKMRAVFEKSDVVHLQFPFWLSFSAMRLARKMGLPVVVAFHVQPENLLQNLGIRAEWPVRRLYRLWVKWFYNRADLVICPSEMARRALVDAGLERPTRVISNGVPRASINQWPVRRERVPGQTRTLLMVGRLAREKQHDVVIEALQRCRHRDQVRLVIAGAGPLEAELRRRIREYPQIEFLGYVSDERLAELYDEADLLVHASDVELEGMVVLEAMARGLPALVADSPRSAAGQFTLSAAYRFRTGDADDLAARLDALLHDPSTLARSRVQHARRAARHVFEDSVAAMVRAYREALGHVEAEITPQAEPIRLTPKAARARKAPADLWVEDLPDEALNEGRVGQVP